MNFTTNRSTIFIIAKQLNHVYTVNVLISTETIIHGFTKIDCFHGTNFHGFSWLKPSFWVLL